MSRRAVSPSPEAPPPAALSISHIENAAHHQSTTNAKPTAWDSPGPAAFDFRSDVVATPTATMLASIAGTSLLDDVFLEDPTTTSLESFISDMTAKPAAVLVMSGTMGNQLAIKTHLTTPPHGIIADSRSHVMGWEAGGLAALSGGFAQPATPQNGHHLTLEDIQKVAVVSHREAKIEGHTNGATTNGAGCASTQPTTSSSSPEEKEGENEWDTIDIHACPTRLISLECTLSGTILPLSETRRISHWARSFHPPISLHLDGARLWEAVSAGAGTMEEYCECFDTVSLCFSKGLGAPIGSILVGGEREIKRARRLRKMYGGGLRQAGVVAAPARVAVEETFLGGLLQKSHGMARRVAGVWEGMGGRLEVGTETNMVWLGLSAAGVGKGEWISVAKEEGVRVIGGRLVVHYQISEEAVERLRRAMERVLKGDKGTNGVVGNRSVAEKEEEERVVNRMKVEVE